MLNSLSYGGSRKTKSFFVGLCFIAYIFVYYKKYKKIDAKEDVAKKKSDTKTSIIEDAEVIEVTTTIAETSNLYPSAKKITFLGISILLILITYTYT